MLSVVAEQHVRRRSSVRIIRAFLVAYGAGSLACSLYPILRALQFLVKIPWWLLPLQFCHALSSIARVTCRRFVGRSISLRWNWSMEVTVEIARPSQYLEEKWDSWAPQMLQALTVLDCYGISFARLLHRGVRIETVSQGCPRPVCWVFFSDDVECAVSQRGRGRQRGASMDFVEVMNTYDSNPDGTAKSATAPADVGGSPESSSSPFRIDRLERRMSADWLDEMTSPKGSSEKPSDLGEDAPELVILYLHGGGYWAFTGKSHLEYVARLVKKIRSTHLRAKACVVDLRRAPEHAWPAPVEDAMASYEWLQVGAGYRPDQIMLAGDSAGGGLCLCLLMALRDANKPLPLCATVISPFTDLSRTEEQYPEKLGQQTDFLTAKCAAKSSQYYMQNKNDLRHPLMSPKFGELHALPPILIQAGEGELLARDSIEYAHRLEVYGGMVQLEMYPDMPHIFPMFAVLGVEDASVAIGRQAKFVKRIVSEDKHKQKRPGRFRVLVRDKGTRSSQDLQALSGQIQMQISHASDPMLADPADRMFLRCRSAD